MLIQIEKLAEEKTASIPSIPVGPLSISAKEMKGLLAILGIGGVMAIMRQAGKAEELQARREEAVVRAEVAEGERERVGRAIELANARGLTAQHMQVALMDRGVYGGTSAPFIMAAARRNQNMYPDALKALPSGGLLASGSRKK